MKAEQKIFSIKDDLKIESFDGFKEHESLLHQAINSFVADIQQKKNALVKDVICNVFEIADYDFIEFCKKHISCVSYEEKPNEHYYFYKFGFKDEKLLVVFYEPEIEKPILDAHKLSYDLKYWSCLDNE